MDLQRIAALIGNRLESDPVLDFVLVVAVVSLIGTFLLSRRLSRLMASGTGQSLEGTIATLVTRLTAVETHVETTKVALNNLDERLQTAVRGVSVRRYDPFENAGGQQSFTSALVNEDGDGVVLSGIHSRDSVRVYAKEVSNFTSAHELSEDETKSIAEAKNKLQ